MIKFEVLEIDPEGKWVKVRAYISNPAGFLRAIADPVILHEWGEITVEGETIHIDDRESEG